MTEAIQQRQAARIKVGIATGIAVLGEDDSELVSSADANITNLSEKGCRVSIDKPVADAISENTRIRMNINFSRGKKETIIVGEVRWKDKHESHGDIAGIRFLEMDSASQKSLASFISGPTRDTNRQTARRTVAMKRRRTQRKRMIVVLGIILVAITVWAALNLRQWSKDASETIETTAQSVVEKAGEGIISEQLEQLDQQDGFDSAKIEELKKKYGEQLKQMK